MTVKDHIVSVRLTEAEYNFIKRMAEKSRISDVIREKLFSVPSIEISQPQGLTSTTGYNTFYLNSNDLSRS